MKTFKCYLIYEDYYKGEQGYKDHYTFVINNVFPITTKLYKFDLIDNLEKSDVVIIPYDFLKNKTIYDNITNKKIILVCRTDACTSILYNLIKNKRFNILSNTILFLYTNGFVDKDNYCKIQNERFFYLTYKNISLLNDIKNYNINTSQQQCLIPHFLRFYFYHNKNHYFIPFRDLNNEIYTNELLIENTDKMINVTNIDFSKKKYDISFVGFVNYDHDIPREHRKKLVKFLNDLKNKSTYNIYVSDKKISKEEMIELMLETKIFISPWGIGEYSGKDYESIILGCILFKPSFYNDKNHYYSYPNIYDNNKTCIIYKYDNSDLYDKLNNTLNNYNELSIYFHKNNFEMFSNLTIKNIKKDYINYFDNILDKKILYNENHINIEYNNDIVFLNLFEMCKDNEYVNIMQINNEIKINIKNMSEIEEEKKISSGIGFNGHINLCKFNIKLDINIDSTNEKTLIYYDGNECLTYKNKLTKKYNTIIFENIYDINQFRFFIDYHELNENFNIFFKNVELIID